MAPSYHINLNHELQSSTKHLEASQLAAAADIQRSCLLTGQNWKRLSVFISINLAIVTLVMGAFVTLDSKGMAPETVKSKCPWPRYYYVVFTRVCEITVC
jgi:hypothetical protein